MQNASTAYRNEMKKIAREGSMMRITFGIEDLDAAPTSSFTDNGHEFYSRLTSLVYPTGIPTQSYATCEKGRTLADGRLLAASRTNPKPQGYVCDVLSDDEGVFVKKPYIHISFSKKHSCPGLSFVFDATTEEYPKELDVIVYRAGAVIETVTVRPDNYSYVHRHDFLDFDGLRLVFKRSYRPRNRARLQNIRFGIGVVFDNTTIDGAKQKTDIDPVMRRQEENTFEFTIINLDGMYDPDNVAGVWEFIEDQQPITAEYGQKIRTGMDWADVYENNWFNLELSNWQAIFEGGYTEWINGGRYVLTGEPDVKGLLATFKARSRLTSLVKPYHKGQYRPGGISLYDLAVEVLEDAEIPEVYEGKKPYILDNGLKEIRTVAPLPKSSHRELLQLIAHAAGMVAYTDREGIIRIEPVASSPVDYNMDFDEMYDWPDTTKVKPLGSVSVNVYAYKPAVEVQELHRGTYSPGSYLVEFEFATDITVTGVKSFAAKSGSVQFTVETAGEVVISGKRIETSTVKETAATGRAGENEEIDNPLVTDRAAGRKLAEHIRDYLMYRTTYEFDYRGSPELEAMDVVTMQSRFDNGFPARILAHNIDFGPTLNGHITAKRMVKQ